MATTPAAAAPYRWGTPAPFQGAPKVHGAGWLGTSGTPLRGAPLCTHSGHRWGRRAGGQPGEELQAERRVHVLLGGFGLLKDQSVREEVA